MTTNLNPQSPLMKTYLHLVLVVLLITSFTQGYATTYTSSGTGGLWNSSSTWGGAGVPGSSDNVIISHGTTVTVNGAYTCNNVTIGDATSSAATLTVSSTNMLTINGALSINPSNTSSTYTLNAAAGTVKVAGTMSWSTSGTNLIEASTGTLTFTPAVTISSSNQSIKLTGAGTINFNSSFTDDYNKLVPYSGGVIKFGGNYTVNTTAASWAAGTAEFSGTGTITANSNLTFYNLQTLASASTTLASASGAVIVANAITLASGSTFTTNEGIEIDGNWTNNGATLSQGSNTITFNNTSTLTGATTFTNLQIGNTASSNTVTLTLNNNVTCSALTINGYNKARTLTVSNGDTLTVNGNIVIDQPTAAKINNLAINGGVCLVSGNLSLVGTVTTASYTSKVTVTTGVLTVNGSVNFDANATAANQLITLTSTGTMNFQSAVTMAYGSLSSTGTGIINFNGSAPSFTFGGSSGPVFTTTNGCTVNFTNGFTNNSNTLTFATNSNSYFISTGTITANAPITFGNVILYSSNTLASTGSTVQVGGSCYLTTGASFTADQSMGVTGAMTVGTGSSYTQSGGTLSVSGDMIDSGTVSGSGSGTISLVGNGANISGNGSYVDADNPVYITNDKTITYGSALTFGNGSTNTSMALATNTTISNGGTIVFNGGIMGTDSSSYWLNNVNGSLAVTGEILDTGSLDASTVPNTVIYNGSGAQYITAPVNSYYDLTISNAGTKTMLQPIQVDDAMDISNSVWVNGGFNALTGLGSLTMTDDAVLELQRSTSVTYPELQGTYDLEGGTVILFQTGGNPGVVQGAVYHDLVLSGDNSLDMSNVSVVSHNLTIDSAAWINNSSTLTVGNMLIDSSTAYSTLYGSLYASGVALYAGTFDDGGNTITIDGTGGWTNTGGTFKTTGVTAFYSAWGVAQTIGGANTTAFHELQIDNPGDNVILGLSPAAPTVVTGFLDLTHGDLVTTSSNILRMTDTSSVLNGSSSSYVNGPMTKVGNSAFVYPVGKDGHYGQIAISGMPSISSEVTAEYFDGSYSVLSPLDTSLAAVSSREYWNVSSADNLDLRLIWSSAAFSRIIQCENLTIAQYNGTEWLNVPSSVIGGSICTGTGSGSIQSLSATTTNTPVTFGSLKTSGGMALPVTLISFNAVGDNKTVLTNWQTASQVNNDYFTVERSANGTDFSPIGTVKGAGTTSSPLSYNFTDDNPLPGVSYYRLGQTDYDGHTTQSPIVSVDMSNNITVANSGFTLFPNPANDQVSIYLVNPSASSVINIYNVLGDLVYSTTYSGNQQINIPTGGKLTPGIYSVSVGTELNKLNQKLVIQ